MPKGKKICPSCDKEHGARKLKCECGHVFGKKAKQESTKAVKQTKHPLGLKYVPVPGLWVFDRQHGLPAIHAPEELPDGPMNNQEIYDQCMYNGVGDCIIEYIPAKKIADQELKKKWKEAQKAMQAVWRYLIDE